MKKNNFKDNWEFILSSILEKENIKGVGGIFGLDGKKYTTKDYFNVSEPTAKAIADLFKKCEDIDNDDRTDSYEPPKVLREQVLPRQNSLIIENEVFLINSLNSRVLYASNDIHCVFAYRCQFTFVLLLFSNYVEISTKRFLYEKMANSSEENAQEQKKPKAAVAIPPVKFGRVVIKIANEIMKQGA